MDTTSNDRRKRKAAVSPKPAHASKKHKNDPESTHEGGPRRTKTVMKKSKTVSPTVDTILSQWSATTEYGISFRAFEYIRTAS